MSARLLGLAVAALAGLPGPAGADEITRRLRDVTVIEDGQGHGRILFRMEAASGLENVAIRSAELILDCPGAASDRNVRLRLYAVSRDWAPGSVGWDAGWRRPGGDVHPQLYTDAELAIGEGQTRVRFDLRSLVKETVERGVESYGLLLTVRPVDGRGIDAEQLARFAGLVNAGVRIEYRRLPPGLPERI